MKCYIRSAVENIYTLKEWVDKFDGPLSAYIHVYTDLYEWCGDFVKLKEYLTHPGKYDTSVHLVSNYNVIDVDIDSTEDYYVLYLAPLQ